NWALLAIILVTGGIAAALVSTLITKLDMKVTGTMIPLSAMAIVLWRQMHIKCPRCHMDVGLGAAMDQTRQCQNCEVSFDEPARLPEGAPAISPPKPLSIGKYVRNRASQMLIYFIFVTALVSIGFGMQNHTKIDGLFVALASGMVISVLAIVVGRV